MQSPEMEHSTETFRNVSQGRLDLASVLWFRNKTQEAILYSHYGATINIGGSQAQYNSENKVGLAPCL